MHRLGGLDGPRDIAGTLDVDHAGNSMGGEHLHYTDLGDLVEVGQWAGAAWLRLRVGPEDYAWAGPRRAQRCTPVPATA